MMINLLFLYVFILGSIPTGFIIGKIYGVDVRKRGSGNIGATNVRRVIGKRASVVTFVFDLAKGYLAAASPLFFSPSLFSDLSSDSLRFLSSACGFVGILGHCFSPFLRFRGGKGVATAFGAFLWIRPELALVSVMIFYGIMKYTRYVSVGSVVAAICFAMMFSLREDNLQTLLAIWCSSLLITARHTSNMKRIFKGQEHAIVSKSTVSNSSRSKSTLS
jgi:glycerol-3-phosphate acyltransferase PlsY